MPAKKKPARRVHVTDRLLSLSRRRRRAEKPIFPGLTLQAPPPGVVPASAKPMLAQDANIRKVLNWAQSNGQMAFDAAPSLATGVMDDAFWAGLTFIGYTLLSELAQRPEYRRISEVLATACTDKWIEIKSTSSDKSKDKKIKELNSKLDDLNTRDVYRRLTEQDGFFGRSHLYYDTGDTDDEKELLTPIGTGRDKLSAEKVGKGHPLKALRTVEPIWVYPQAYNSINPLRDDWYNPQRWFCMGTEVHASRLPRLVGREVPDILKPTYNFGGLSLTQMSMSYVNNWLAVRQGTTDLILSFAYTILKTDLASAMQPGFEDQLQARIELLTNWRSNKGTIALDKNEEFENIATPLGTLDALQAQSMEQMCFPAGIPVVVLFGIQPAGLNASSEGEIRTWEKWVASYQQKFMRNELRRTIDFAQLSLWGAVDPDITFDFIPLRELSEKEEAELRKIEADTDAIYVDIGAVGNDEVRKRLATDPTSIYSGLDVDKMPEQDMDTDVDPEEVHTLRDKFERQDAA